MTASRFLSLYDQQLRGEAEVSDADELTRVGPLYAATFPARRRGFVTYERLPAGVDLARLVSAAVEHYANDGRVDHFEWKTRGHDDLHGLDDVLRGHGFAFEDPETVMVGSVQDAIAAAGPLPDGYVVERARSAATIRAAEAVAGRVFGDDPEHSQQRADELVARFERAPESFEMWLVRDGTGAAVCSGRVEFVPGTDFAGLWGGACDPAHRGRGLYRAITAERARVARDNGHRYLQSDCTEYSRPILERAGLVRVTTTTPAVWRRPSQGDRSWSGTTAAAAA